MKEKIAKELLRVAKDLMSARDVKFRKWVKGIIEDIDFDIRVGNIENDFDYIYDSLKSNYRAGNTERDFIDLVSAVSKWYKRRK